MQFLVYIIAYPFLWFISILPFRVLYLLSDCVYLIIYYLIGYRKKTVRDNLALTLPHLSTEERLSIEKKSYRHLCDMFLEMVKTMTMSPKEMRKRFVVTNIEIFREYEKENKSMVLLASHYASWEWLLTINDQTSLKGIGVYKQVNNKYFDRLVRNIRSKYGTELVVTRETIPYIIKNQKENIACVYGLASDQRPQLSKTFHWNPFMGVTVPVHTGAESIAKKYNLGVEFIRVRKVKRGYYEATFIPIAKSPRETEEYQITNDFLLEVEKQIIEAPELYFWTHKRWKHIRPVVD
ncbi:lysophospholipid acyltransferase family protein [Flavobacterium algicola]|uniref:lysophospholipid acyltransferase family protein n=1 Tax=Flavobacterium algicola TaxID=556529 RepID=UPI001EFE61D6|nr:lysophospholipid acyltransferase family protein [Flavobacterium algicola]MCG9790852.1 lysophospholipid acyltransferase family protein [Flavobacterium algicola]